MRIRRRSTTILLELPFWKALEEIADSRGMNLNTLIEQVEGDCHRRHKRAQDKTNLASCLRVYCLEHLTKFGEASSSTATPSIHGRPAGPA